MSWGLLEAPGRFQRARNALGARGASWEQAVGASSGPRKVPGMLWERAGGFLRPQEGSKDPGMLWE